MNFIRRIIIIYRFNSKIMNKFEIGITKINKMATGNTARNDVTNDLIKSKPISKEGRENWDNIFSSKNKLIRVRDNF